MKTGSSPEKRASHSYRSIQAWCMYDWAISGFQTTIVGAVLPIFFRDIACYKLPENLSATSLWGYISALAMIFVALLSLILGPLSDYRGMKKQLLAVFTGLGIVLTAFLSLTGPGDWMVLSILFILASTAAAGSEVFYDSLLPHVAPPGQIARISTRGYAFGYMGGGLLLVLNVLMIQVMPKMNLPDGNTVPVLGMQISFISVAVWWGLFAIPLFRQVRENQTHVRSVSLIKDIRISLRRLKSTFREIRNFRAVFIFLIAFWFYSDGIGTVIKMATVYGKDIGIHYQDLIGAFLLVQFIGIPCTMLFNKISRVLGVRTSIWIGLLVYIGISIGGFFMQKAIHFWILAAAVGLVQGGTQALSRSYYAMMIPKAKSAEFFSFFNISGKFAGIMGPVLFGLTAQFFHNSRYGILSLVFFFIFGGILLLKVPEQSPEAI